jgi:REP element-mobilizing transposase RayT
MARPLRIDYPGAIYHVTCRGNERRAIFGDDADRDLVAEHVALRETVDSRSTASRSLGAGTRAYVAFRKRGREE